MGLAMLFISHDLAVVDHLCARVAVMRHGKIIEHASREAILSSPEHAYTRELLTASGGDAPRPHAPLREGVRE
jgi:ABC-type dipeptide/oligopeptide/nickel transport system ATPase component